MLKLCFLFGFVLYEAAVVSGTKYGNGTKVIGCTIDFYFVIVRVAVSGGEYADVMSRSLVFHQMCSAFNKWLSAPN